MKKTERIHALSWLGANMLPGPEPDPVLVQARLKNGFFTEEFSRKALVAIAGWHSEPVLSEWLKDVPESMEPKNVGLVLAGNIPLVGWHDMLSVFASGNRAYYKPSSSDEVLVDHLVKTLVSAFPEAGPYFQKVDRLNGVDALIATGSRNTAQHFNYYFRHVPRLIRGSRSSLGIVYGFESWEELSPLCDDVLLYFGMGCRNVTKLLVPEGYDFSLFFQALEKYRYLTDHHKFQNNAIYHKSIFLMNGDSFLDNDILMVREEKSLFSPPAVLNFETYADLEEARKIVEGHLPDLQCIVSHQGQFPGSIPFGTSQNPGIQDYADGVNTMEFLMGLHS